MRVCVLFFFLSLQRCTCRDSLTTRSVETKVPMRIDAQAAEKERDEPRHRNEEPMAVLLFAVREAG